jgi:hypothetical protein
MRVVARAIISGIALTLLPAAVPAGAQEARPKVVRSKPAQPVEIDGVPCAAGYVFREEGTGRLLRRDRNTTRLPGPGYNLSCGAPSAQPRHGSGRRTPAD